MCIISFTFFVSKHGSTQKSLRHIATKTKDENIHIKITATGDVLAHEEQLESQYNSETKKYDFNNNFVYIAPYIKKADISICNLETTLAGKESNGFSGYPVFNSPDELLSAVKNAGFNVVSAINNHCIDKGSYGFKRTARVITSNNLTLLGMRCSPSEKRYSILNVKGIKVGLMSYCFETQSINGQKTLNSIKIPKDVIELANTFNPNKKDCDLPIIKKEINSMKNDGAEVIILVMHWGDEYKNTPNEYQKYMAKELIDSGVNIILGSHPHVLEPMEYIENSSGKKGLVVYSMGNILSNQRYEKIGNRFTEDGIIVNINLTKNIKNGEISIDDTNYIPTWVNRFNKGKLYSYEILPLTDAIKSKDTFNLNSKETIIRAENSYNNTTSLMDNSSFKVSQGLNDKEISVFKNNK